MTHSDGNDELDRDLTAIAARLESERPVPRPAFRGDLRRRLMIARPGPGRLSRRGALALTAAYAGSGLTLLAIAALGVIGAGPLAA
jgi:hypothetical protein